MANNQRPWAKTPNAMKTVILRYWIAATLLLLVSGTRAADPARSVPSLHTSNSIAMERAVEHQINRYVIFPLTDEEEAMFGTVEVRKPPANHIL